MTQSTLRIVFAGTPEFAARHLEALIIAGFLVVGAYSQPDRPTGRGKHIQPTPVKALAQQHGIPVYQPLDLRAPSEQEVLAAMMPDVMVVVAYGLLLPPAVLALPAYGCINVHASLLPRWRGAAPIERALMAGDSETGISIMQMDEGLDTGPVLQLIRTPIRPDDNAESLGERLAELGCQGLCSVLDNLPAAASHAQQQEPSRVTYARKIDKTEALIDWNQPALQLHNLVRALYPRSPAYSLHQGKRLRLIRTEIVEHDLTKVPGRVLQCSSHGVDVACGEGSLRLLEVQLEGKSVMSISSLMNGHPGFFAAGMQLGSG